MMKSPQIYKPYTGRKRYRLAAVIITALLVIVANVLLSAQVYASAADIIIQITEENAETYGSIGEGTKLDIKPFAKPDIEEKTAFSICGKCCAIEAVPKPEPKTKDTWQGKEHKGGQNDGKRSGGKYILLIIAPPTAATPEAENACELSADAVAANDENATETETAASESRYTEITADEREMMARLVWLEARGEPMEGQQAVAEVVLNRLISSRFPSTVHDVIYQRKQFTPARRIPNTTPTAIQYAAVDAALSGPYILPPDVVYFSGAAQNSRVFARIGGHVFCFV